MGRYFNPPTIEEVESQGGRTIRRSNSYADLVNQLQPGETVAVFIDRMMFTQVADLFDDREFQAFREATRQYPDVRFYAIPKDAAGWDRKFPG